MVEINVFASLMQWVVSPLLWLFAILGAVLVIFGFLYLRRRARLKYTAIELMDIGNDKCAYILTKAGFFGKDRFLKGLWWKGSPVLMTKENIEIHNFSSKDFQEINGRRGIICCRKSDDQEILVPVAKTKIENEEILQSIAPEGHRDIVVKLIDQNRKETQDWTEKYLPYIIIGGTIILGLVTIIMIVQYSKSAQAEASNLILEAGKTCLSNAQEVCSAIVSRASSAP